MGELLGETNIGQEWFNGRQLLWNDQESQGSFHLETLLEINDEIKTRDFLVALVATGQLEFVKFEEWKELCSLLAYTKRFRNNCKENSKKLKEFLTADEVKNAKIAVINHIQQSIFHAELNSLKEKKPITNSKIKELNPFIDERVTLRVGGRLKHAKIPHDSKHQIILPSNHHISELIVRSIGNCGDMGTEYILLILRKSYWIVKLRSLIKRIARRCSFSKRRNAKKWNL